MTVHHTRVRFIFGFPNHDVLLIIDSILDFDDEESAKGWYCGGGADDLNMVICRSRSKTEHEDLFGIDYFHRGVAHELGHYRGVTDLYADRIRAKNNPVNHIEYEPDSCVMNSHYNSSDRFSPIGGRSSRKSPADPVYNGNSS